MTDCPCGSGKPFEDCCAPAITGTAPAATAEALMRSRYSAYVKGDFEYLGKTLATATAEDYNADSAEASSADVTWTGLEIRSTELGGPDDDTGMVEFAAKFRQNGQDLVHHERSVFEREDGQWVYVDGIINPKSAPVTVEKVGRNDPCPCGSGKKYKKCCGAN